MQMLQPSAAKMQFYVLKSKSLGGFLEGLSVIDEAAKNASLWLTQNIIVQMAQ
jgi:hypothetical protein